MDNLDMDTSPPRSRHHQLSASRSPGDGLPYRHPLRPAPGAPIRNFERSPRPSESGRDYDYSDSESVRSDNDHNRRELDVDDEIDELLSDEEGEEHGDADGEGDGEGEGEGGGDVSRRRGKKERPENRNCMWDECNEALETQDDLVQHVHNLHIGPGRAPYACLWRTCHRVGHKQASRHALLTHIRSHTGEKPYTCPEQGCGRHFTRSDAMNKHVRAIHGPGGPKKRQAVGDLFTAAGIDDEPTSADKDLAKDDDLTEVVLRLRSRDRVHFRAETAEEEAALRYVRESRPGGAPVKRGRGTGRRPKGAPSDSDEFDEGAGKRYPTERTVEGYMVDLSEAEVPVMGRSRWQAKYVMAKAKLMLVDEENKMRREELAFWLAEEEKVFGPRAKEAKEEYELKPARAPRHEQEDDLDHSDHERDLSERDEHYPHDDNDVDEELYGIA